VTDLFAPYSLGRLELANRFGAELNLPDVATFYAGGAKGYTDYPTLTA